MATGPVGRDRELALLADRIDAARRGVSSATVLHGAAGAGKTTLLAAAERRAEGFTVLRATGTESEADLPYAGLAELVAPVLGLLGSIPPPQRAALESALAIADGPADRFVVGAALVSLLGAAAEATPVLCLVDDAQWLDRPTLDAVRFAARRLGNEGVVLLVASRGAEAPDADLGPLPSLPLGPLARDDAERLVDAVAGGRLHPDLRTRVLATAEGNPLALTEMTLALGDGTADPAPEVPLPPGRSAAGLFERRLGALPERTRDALLVVAAAGEETPGAWRAALEHAGLDVAALEPAEDAGLLRIDAGQARFRHPLVRSVAYHGPSPTARRRAHAVVAAALEPGDPARPWQLAAAAAGPDEAVAEALEGAATAARRRGAHAVAARAHQRAAALTPRPADRARRLLAAAEDLRLAGETEAARTAVEAALPLSGGPADRLRGETLLATLELMQGRPVAARERFHTVVEAGRGDPVAAGLLLMQAAFAARLAGDSQGWRDDADRAVAALEGVAPGLTQLARGVAGAARVATGDPEEGRRRLEAAADAEAVRAHLGGPVPPQGVVETLGLVAQAWSWLDEWDRAQSIVDVLLAELQAGGAVAPVVYPSTILAWCEIRRGSWEAADARASEAIRLGQETEQWIPMAGALSVRAMLRAARGDAEGCRADAALTQEHARRLGSSLLTMFGDAAQGLLALGRRELPEAVDHLARAHASCVADGVEDIALAGQAFDLVEALTLTGQDADASALLEDLRARAERAGRLAAQARAYRCAGLLAGDDVFEDAFAAALDLHDAAPVPFERARTLLCLGERLRRARRPTDSREPIREALGVFDRLGARPWSARARAELRAAGGAVPVHAPAVFAELTPHEIHVAQLVAQGRTNREIAAALFIAPKTVEHHVSRIFKKLGVRRRTAIAGLAGGLGDPEQPQRAAS